MSTADTTPGTTIALDGFPEPPAWGPWQQDGERFYSEVTVGEVWIDDRECTVIVTAGGSLGIGAVTLDQPRAIVFGEFLNVSATLDLYITLRRALGLLGVDLEQEVPMRKVDPAA